MKKRVLLVCLALFIALSMNAQAVNYSIRTATGGIVISGNADHVGDSVNVAVYDKHNELLYIDQTKTEGSTAFEFRAAVDTQVGLKVVVGGPDYSPTMQYTRDEESTDVCYVGDNTAANADGTLENPYPTIGDAYAQVEDGGRIFVMDETAWDNSITGDKSVTLMGTSVRFSANTVITPDVRLENVKIIAPEGCTVTAGDLVVGKNVVFSNPVNVSAASALLKSGTYGNITAQKVVVEEHIDVTSITGSELVSINKDAAVSADVCSNCDYVVKTTSGGAAVILNHVVTLVPEDERVVSVNSGAFAPVAQITQSGVYDVVFDYDFKLHSIDLQKNVSGYTAKIEISAYNRNADESKEGAILIAGVYDGSEQMKYMRTDRLTTGSADSISINIPVNETDGENLTARFFVWDSFDQICPLCEFRVCALTDTEKDSDTYFVAPNGSDSNEGTLAKPFQTLQAAVNAAKNKSLPVTVYLRGGTYNVNQQIALGSSCSNITFKPYNNEKPIITTGYTLSGSDFTHDSDSVTASITDSTARANVVVASLADLGITDISGIYDYRNNSIDTVAPILMQDDKRMEIARYPDTGYLTVTNPSGGNGSTAMQFTVSGGLSRAANWNTSDVYADGYMAYDWKDSRAKVTFSNGTATAVDNTLAIQPQSGKRVRFINIPQEISMPGEWYLDYNTKKLYMYPYDNFSADSSITLNSNVSSVSPLFALNGCSDITFEGIEFKHIGTTVMNLESVEGFTVKDCHFIDTIGDCITSLYSNDMMVKDNKFEYLSGGGVALHGGDAAKLIKSNNFVTNNEFHDFSLDRRTYTPAINIEGCGNTVSHNEIYNSPHTAIGIHGISFTVEYNDIYNVCNDTADSGALYSGQRVHLVDNKIKNNYFHGIKNRIGDGYSVNAIYFDDLWSSAEVSSNVFYDVDTGVLVGGGRSNSINNNLFIASNRSVKVDGRGDSINFSEHQAYVNLYYSPAGNNKSEVWLKEYPEVCNILNDAPAKAKYNSVYNNICVGTSTPTIESTPRTYATRIDHNVSVSASTIRNAFYDYSNQKFEIVNENVIKNVVSDFILYDFDAIGMIQ